MRRFLAGVVALFLAATLAIPVLAQSGASVRQSGSSVTPNTVPYWVVNGVIGDSVTAADSPVTSFGVTSSGQLGNCVNSARQASAGYIGLCEGFVSGVPTISVQNYGAASAQPLQFIVNGTTYPFPGSLAQIIIASTPVQGGTNGDCLNITAGILGQIGCSILNAGTTGTGLVVLNNSPTLTGTIVGNPTFSGSLTFSGNTSFGSDLVVNGTATPASSGGNTVLLGTVSAPTLTNNGQAFLFNTVIGGATLSGDGSSFDVTIANKNGSAAMQVTTGTTGVTFPGVLTLSGLSSGTCANSVVLNASNQTILGSCPGAASSIQVGSTTVLSGTNANILYNNSGTLGNETIASILTAGTAISITGTTNATIALGGTSTAHGVALWEGGASNLGNSGAGTTGQALISQGGSADPVYVGGALVLLATLPASNSPTLSDTSHITSTYNEYVLVFENIVPITNNVSCELQVHTNGAFPVTSYSANVLRFASTTVVGQATSTFIPCNGANGNLANSGTGLSGEITLYNASQTGSPKMWAGMFAENNSALGDMVNGAYTGANTAIDGFQVLMSSGNISSGTIKLYGRL